MKVYESRHVANCDEPKTATTNKKSHDDPKKKQPRRKDFLCKQENIHKIQTQARTQGRHKRKDNDLSDSLRHMS